MNGSIGGSFLTRNFSAAGEEALSPEVDQRGGAVYLYEEVAASPHVQIQFGGRVEHASFEPKARRAGPRFHQRLRLRRPAVPADRPDDDRVQPGARRRATRRSRSCTSTDRTRATTPIENGNPDLESEHALGFDASFRWRGAVASGEVTFFVNRINNFIFREFTGEVDEEEGLAETVFAQADGRLDGVESHIDVKVGPLIWIEGGLDYVRGELTSLDTPMPRIPPLRGRAGVRLQKNAFQAGVDGIFTAKQDRIYAIDFGGESSARRRPTATT